MRMILELGGERMKEYQTEQKKMLLLYLSSHAERAFSLAELAAALSECGVGKSTVYRLVARLCDEGAVRRFAREGARGFAYQYLPGGECATHLHLRCTACGRLFHLDAEASRRFAALLERHNGFLLDGGHTTLLGRCGDCAAAESKQ